MEVLMTLSVFLKDELVASGAREEVVPKMRELQPLERTSDLLAFDDETGKQIDIDLRPEAEAPRPRGRPALGVEAKEVTLLPRHWEWLATQRGGASATLRQLVDAVREMYAGNKVGYDHFSYGWPRDIRDHGRRMAFPV